MRRALTEPVSPVLPSIRRRARLRFEARARCSTTYAFQVRASSRFLRHPQVKTHTKLAQGLFSKPFALSLPQRFSAATLGSAAWPLWWQYDHFGLFKICRVNDVAHPRVQTINALF